MREHCYQCVLKHLGAACVLMDEAELGYPLHKWIAVGHLVEAESEALDGNRELAERIRNLRRLYSFDEGIIEILPLILDTLALLHGPE
jgi:hypothetical protein